MPVRVVSQLAAAREELRPHVLFGEGSGMRQLQGLRVWEERFLLRWLGRIGEVDSGQYSAALPFRASDWKLDHPDWTGRLRVTSKGKTAYIKLEDKVSGKGKAVPCQGCDSAPEPVFLSLPRAVHGSPGHALGSVLNT